MFVPDDLKGQTIRVPPIPTLVEVFKQFGANPVPMIWGEVYMAVRQGTVDGLELPVDHRGLGQVPRDHQVLLEDAPLLPAPPRG